MPIYEYICASCETRFDLLRSMSQADHPARCPKCESEDSRRAPSRCACFARSSDGSSAPVAGGGGGGCGSCAGGHCGSCHH